MYKAGVSVRALLDATYVCVGFNIISRIADALGFKVPSEEQLLKAARFLRIFGYRRLSGFWISYSRDKESTRMRTVRRLPYWRGRASSSLEGHLQDPYAKKMERLRSAVVSGAGSLPSDVRQTIIEGAEVTGQLGVFVQKVAGHAFTVNDDDIAELHRAHYTDDQIFEAAVTSAVGAGLFRLECVLAALRACQSSANNQGELGAQTNNLRKHTRVKVTA